jgi:hypothetical protein
MHPKGVSCERGTVPDGLLTRQSYIGSLAGTLDCVPSLFLCFGMVLLRKSSAQARIEGWDPRNRSEDDYAVVDDTIVGRIYREMILGMPKWRWFLQKIPEAGPGRPIPPRRLSVRPARRLHRLSQLPQERVPTLPGFLAAKADQVRQLQSISCCRPHLLSFSDFQPGQLGPRQRYRGDVI